MNAIECLESDHDSLTTLFEKYRENDGDDNGGLFAEINRVIRRHIALEESIFYPSCQASGNTNLKQSLSRRMQEHDEIKMLVTELSLMPSTDRGFNFQLKKLIDMVEYHIQEEEGELFPLVENEFDEEELDALGVEIASAAARQSDQAQ